MSRQSFVKSRNILKYRLLIPAILFLLSSNLFAQKIYSFGVVPQQTASKMARTWGPIMKYLRKETGYGFEFATAKDIPAFENLLAQGMYDFAYMNPYHYVVYHKQSGYQAFAKASDSLIRGIIVARKDSPYKSLADLAGQQLVFPSPKAFAATLLTRHELAQQGVDYKPVYVFSHDSVYRSVVEKNYVAGGGVVRTFEAMAPEVRDQLQILFTTAGYTPHAFAASANIPAEVVVKVRAAFIRLGQDPIGRKLLDDLKFKGVEAAKDSDWNDVRKLRIQD